MSQQDLPDKSGRVIIRGELRIETGFPQISCTPPARSDSDQPSSHCCSSGTTTVLEDAHAQPEIPRRFPHQRHDVFHLSQPLSEFAQIPCSCSGSRPINTFSLPDMILSFLAISSSVRSNTFNAVALSFRDSPGEIVTARTPQGTLSHGVLVHQTVQVSEWTQCPSSQCLRTKVSTVVLRLHCF